MIDKPTDHAGIADEIESVFLVILYVGLRYLRNMCPNAYVAIFDYFDRFERCGD